MSGKFNILCNSANTHEIHGFFKQHMKTFVTLEFQVVLELREMMKRMELMIWIMSSVTVKATARQYVHGSKARKMMLNYLCRPDTNLNTVSHV